MTENRETMILKLITKFGFEDVRTICFAIICENETLTDDLLIQIMYLLLEE